MKWINHIAIGGAITAVIKPELVPLAVLGATAPDWLEWVLRAMGRHVAHRTTTHYVTSWCFGLLFGLFAFDYHYMITAFCAGGLSHVLCDACTVMGVPLSRFSRHNTHLFGARLHTGQMGEYFVAAGVVMICIYFGIATKNWNGSYTPFFYDWADYYKQGLIDGHEWKQNRFRWL